MNYFEQSTENEWVIKDTLTYFKIIQNETIEAWKQRYVFDTFSTLKKSFFFTFR